MPAIAIYAFIIARNRTIEQYMIRNPLSPIIFYSTCSDLSFQLSPLISYGRSGVWPAPAAVICGHSEDTGQVSRWTNFQGIIMF